MDTDELNRLKQRLKAQLRQQRANPNFLSNERFSRAVYGSHPAAVVSATNESIDATTSEMLTKWHQERYTPQNTILGITGDVKAAEIVPKLEKALAAWKKTDLQEVLPPNPKPSNASYASTAAGTLLPASRARAHLRALPIHPKGRPTASSVGRQIRSPTNRPTRFSPSARHRLARSR